MTKLFYLFYFISFAIKTAYSYNTIIMRRKEKKKYTIQWQGIRNSNANYFGCIPPIYKLEICLSLLKQYKDKYLLGKSMKRT